MKKVGGLVGATALSFGALAALAPAAGAEPLVVVCITIQDKSVDLVIGGVELLTLGPIGLERTCIVI